MIQTYFSYVTVENFFSDIKLCKAIQFFQLNFFHQSIVFEIRALEVFALSHFLASISWMIRTVLVSRERLKAHENTQRFQQLTELEFFTVYKIPVMFKEKMATQ